MVENKAYLFATFKYYYITIEASTKWRQTYLFNMHVYFSFLVNDVFIQPLLVLVTLTLASIGFITF